MCGKLCGTIAAVMLVGVTHGVAGSLLSVQKPPEEEGKPVAKTPPG
jgi:hypothetical protein